MLNALLFPQIHVHCAPAFENHFYLGGHDVAKKPPKQRQMPDDVRFSLVGEALERLMRDLERILLDDAAHVVTRREKLAKQQEKLSPAAREILSEATRKQLKILRASGKEITDAVWRHGVEELRLLYGDDAVDAALKEMKKGGH